MALERGTRLGPYQIESPLGAGGMGAVYKAHDPTLQRTVAIKVLAKQDEDASARLLQEAVEAPAPQGARREHTGSIRPTSNAAGRDASAAECRRNYETGH